MCGNEQGTRMLTDVAVTGDRNVIKRGAGRILQYKDCTVETERMCTVNTERQRQR